MKKIFLFLLLVSPAILIHELVHLGLGLALGLNPQVFSFGFGPELVGSKIGEIYWKISLIPLGGYVEFPGELVANKPMDTDLSYALVAIMGPITNFILAYLVLTSLLYFLYRKKRWAMVEVSGVHKSVFFFDLKTNQHLFSKSLFGYFSREDDKIVRQDQEIKVVSTISKMSGIQALKKSLAGSFEILWAREKTQELKDLLKLATREGDLESSGSGIVGPLGVANLATSAKNQSWAMFIFLTVIINQSLGILNILPLSLFDGGQALLSVVKWIIQGPIPAIILMIYSAVSIGLIGALIFSGIFNDVLSVFRRR